MGRAVVGRWGRSLAVRVPAEVARAAGLAEGEEVEVEEADGDLLIRRSKQSENARRLAQAAVEEIIADRKRHKLEGISIRELIDEGRRG